MNSFIWSSILKLYIISFYLYLKQQYVRDMHRTNIWFFFYLYLEKKIKSVSERNHICIWKKYLKDYLYLKKYLYAYLYLIKLSGGVSESVSDKISGSVSESVSVSDKTYLNPTLYTMHLYFYFKLINHELSWFWFYFFYF